MPRAILVCQLSPRESGLWCLQDWPGAVRAGFLGDGLVLKCDLMQKMEMSGRRSVRAAFRVGKVMCGGIGPGQGLRQEGTGLMCVIGKCSPSGQMKKGHQAGAGQDGLGAAGEETASEREDTGLGSGWGPSCLPTLHPPGFAGPALAGSPSCTVASWFALPVPSPPPQVPEKLALLTLYLLLLAKLATLLFPSMPPSVCIETISLCPFSLPDPGVGGLLPDSRAQTQDVSKGPGVGSVRDLGRCPHQETLQD